MCSVGTPKSLDSGVYVVWLYLREPLCTAIGKLGTQRFQPGTYAYCGSAQRNMQARLRRHERTEKPLRWHIDYFRRYCQYLGHNAFDERREGECRVAAQLVSSPRAEFPMKGFGSSDCHCVSHLVRVADECLSEHARRHVLNINDKELGIGRMDKRIVDDIKTAERLYAEGPYRLVIVKHGKLLYAANEPRLLPLAKGLVQLGTDARGVVVKDKVIGRAAAMLVAAFGAAAVVSPLISSAARTLLEDAKIMVEAENEIPRILNQTGDDSCPMEAMVESFADAESGAQHLLDFFAEKSLLQPYALS